MYSLVPICSYVMCVFVCVCVCVCVYVWVCLSRFVNIYIKSHQKENYFIFTS